VKPNKDEINSSRVDPTLALGRVIKDLKIKSSLDLSGRHGI
jgi:hypothetical protein